LPFRCPSSLAPLMAARNCADHRVKFCRKPNSGFDELAIVELGSGTM
jgi:hypothetical protein